jgi:hypothetical protein
MRVVTKLTALLAVAALGACADGTGPTSQAEIMNADAAMIAGDATAQDVEMMQGPAGPAFGMHLGFHPARFDCLRETPPRLTVERSCVFKDADGVVQSAYDPITTATVVMSATISGEIDRGHLEATINHTHELTVTGLAGTETSRTWNGNGSGTFTAVRTRSDGTERSYSVASQSTVTNVVIPVPRTLTSWPLSGTIHRVLTLTRNDGTVVTRDVLVTFNGTQIVTVVVNGETFEFDLADRRRPHWRRG